MNKKKNLIFYGKILRLLQRISDKVSNHLIEKYSPDTLSWKDKIALRNLLAEINFPKSLFRYELDMTIEYAKIWSIHGMPVLTSKEMEVLTFIRHYKKEHDGNSPSMREIVKAGISKSTGHVSPILDSLEEKRYIKRASNKARSIELSSYYDH